MGYIHPTSLKVKKLPFSYTVYSKEQLEVINEYQKRAKVHLKVDTGMHRLGIAMDELEDFVKNIKDYQNVDVEGLMSHIAFQEDLTNELTKSQIKNFQKAKHILEKHGINPKWIHLAASGPTLSKNIKSLSKISNVARVGLALYGINDNPKLKPVLKVISQIVQIKKLNKGDKVGYSGTFTAQSEAKLAVLPIGYNDGVDRRLSNKGMVIVRRKACPIIGLVNMNITTIDITQAGAKEGDEVTVFSNDPKAPNSIQNSAGLTEAIPYELLIHLNPISLRREIEN